MLRILLELRISGGLAHDQARGYRNFAGAEDQQRIGKDHHQAPAPAVPNAGAADEIGRSILQRKMGSPHSHPGRLPQEGDVVEACGRGAGRPRGRERAPRGRPGRYGERTAGGCLAPAEEEHGHTAPDVAADRVGALLFTSRRRSKLRRRRRALHLERGHQRRPSRGPPRAGHLVVLENKSDLVFILSTENFKNLLPLLVRCSFVK